MSSITVCVCVCAHARAHICIYYLVVYDVCVVFFMTYLCVLKMQYALWCVVERAWENQPSSVSWLIEACQCLERWCAWTLTQDSQNLPFQVVCLLSLLSNPFWDPASHI
jgi:hypothetical protein